MTRRRPWRWWIVRQALNPRTRRRRYTVAIHVDGRAPRLDTFWRRTAAVHRFADALEARVHAVQVCDDWTGERLLSWEHPHWQRRIS